MLLRHLVLMTAAVVVASLVGAFAAMLTRAVYPMILVPAAMGAVIGAALGFLGYGLAIRSRGVTWAATVVATVVSLAAFHWVEYRVGFTNAVMLYAQLDEPAGGGLGTDPDAVLEALTGHSGFGGFLRLRILAGARLRLFRGLGSPEWLAGLLWALDALLAFAVMATIVQRVRRRVVSPTAAPGSSLAAEVLRDEKG